MGRSLGGFLFAVTLVAAGGAWWVHTDACLGRCGGGTRCVEQRCVVAPSAPTAPVVAAKDRRHHWHSSAAANSDALNPAPAEVELHPGDEKMIAQGDALGRPEHIDLSQPDERALTQDDLDHVVHAVEPAIFRCITDAVGAAPLDGKVEVGMRVEKTGSVSRVRVEAPTLLQKHGLTHCVRTIVAALQFPASGGANVVTYPFELK
jgi:hypothetical protein